jgi:hypothetical protein
MMSSKIAIGSAVRFVLGGMLSAVTAAPALAQSNSQGLLTDSLVINAGVFVLGTDVKGRLNGNTTANSDVDFNGTFGKPSDVSRARLDALWRINPKHHLRFLYFNDETTRTRAIDRDVTWGDATYHLGASVESVTKFSVYELAYEYAFVREPTYEIAASGGVHYMDMSFQLSGAATVNGGTVAQFSRQSSSLPAPLPVIGLRAGWAVSPQWYLGAQGQVFAIKVDGYDGNWTDVRLDATWMFSRHFGIGTGYNYFGARIDVDRTAFHGRLDLAYSGLQVFLTGSF